MKENKPFDTTKYFFTKRQIWIAGVITVVLFGALWIWKTIQITEIRNKAARSEEDIKAKARAQYVQTEKRFLKLLAKPYVWAVRNEMMQKNVRQVDLYNNDLVKERGILDVMVVDQKGEIVTSTDKKYEGKDFGSVNSLYYINMDSTIVQKINDSLLIMASPVMSFNSRIATVIMHYNMKPPF